MAGHAVLVRRVEVRVLQGQQYMVVIVLAVSTSDCGSDRMGSNPIIHPKCPNGGIGRHSGLRSRGESLRVRVSLWVQNVRIISSKVAPSTVSGLMMVMCR